MREPPVRRDQREIVVPGDMRAGRSPARSPRRKPAARGPAASGWRATALSAAAGAGQFCLRYPGGVSGTLLGVGAAVYVCVNAMGFQAGPHPAPILPTVESKPVAARSPAPPAPQPVREIRTAAAAPKSAPVREAPPAPRDAIADMIRSGETTASVTPKPPKDTKADAKADAKAEAKTEVAKTEGPKPDPTVTRVQRALTKLGYGPLKDDGLMGPGTKAAIEKFERDRKLPVKGEAAGPTLRALTREMTAKASG